MKKITLNGKRGKLDCLLFEPDVKPRGSVLFLPGMPGTDQNEDIAEMLCWDRFRVLCLSYSGSNKSDGSYSIENALEDSETAYTFLHDSDPDGVSVLGHSMGGFVCAQLAAGHPDTKAIVMMFPCDIGRLPVWEKEAFMTSEVVKDFFYSHTGRLKGTSPDHLLSEVFTNAERYSLAHLAPALAKIPLYMIGGSSDYYAPPALNCAPLRNAVDQVPGHGGKLFYQEFPAGHYGAESRDEITRSILTFMDKNYSS